MEAVLLPKELTIVEAVGLHALLAEAAGAGDMTLDFINVQRIDAAGLQLLVSLYQESRAGRCRVRFVNVQEKLFNSFGTYGVEDLGVIIGSS